MAHPSYTNQSEYPMSVFTTLFTSLISPVTNYFTKREDRKQLKVNTEAKIKMAKQTGQLDVTLTDAEWESISVQQNGDSLKDEWITVTFLMLIWSVMLGSVWSAVKGDPAIINGILEGIKLLQNLGIDFGLLTEVVVYAGVGIKATRQVFK